MPIKSRKESLNQFAAKLKEDFPDVHKIYRECMAADRREFISMVAFAKRIGAPEPVIGTLMTEYLNKIWPYIERYKP